ncbi:MAG: universal stress protein [Gemmatimonadaceae bacterium]|nr:universal stress protein [Gemmatimonadaceae bacterium]
MTSDDTISSDGADLIAAGTHGHGSVARAVLGSVTSDLLRGAHCAVLLVPREPLTVRTEATAAPAAAPAPPAARGGVEPEIA